MKHNITGILLAGGQNSRMGGQKKLFLSDGEHQFYEKILASLSCLDRIALSVESKEPYSHLGLPMLVDLIPKIGPMGGIYTALKTLEDADAILAVSCDSPFLSEDTVKLLAAEYEKEPRIVMLQFGDKISPLPGIYPKEALPVLEQMIAEENYRLMQIAKRYGKFKILQLPEDSPDARNINTIEEYKALLDAIKK